MKQQSRLLATIKTKHKFIIKRAAYVEILNRSDSFYLKFLIFSN